jgi:hypothetical protein
MSDKPRGITVVAVLTLLGSLAWFFVSAFLGALGSMGHAGTPIDSAAMFRIQMFVYPPLVLSLLSFIAFIAMSTRSRVGWYLPILAWILSIAYLIYAAFALLPISLPLASVEYIFVVDIILVNIVFIVYFQTRKVKNYFRISG